MAFSEFGSYLNFYKNTTTIADLLQDNH